MVSWDYKFVYVLTLVGEETVRYIFSQTVDEMRIKTRDFYRVVFITAEYKKAKAREKNVTLKL